MTIFWAIERFRNKIEHIKYNREIANFINNTKNRTLVLVEYQDTSCEISE